MSLLIWPALAVVITAAMMLFERRGRFRDEPSNPVHYGHSNVADHEYDNLPPTSSGAVESDAGDPDVAQPTPAAVHVRNSTMTSNDAAQMLTTELNRRHRR